MRIRDADVHKAQGTIMMGYPSEENKGRYISYFWSIFNLGAGTVRVHSEYPSVLID
jgi:hypothetical protein